MGKGDALLSLQLQFEAMFNRAIQGRARGQHDALDEQIQDLTDSLTKKLGYDVNNLKFNRLYKTIQREIENLKSALPASNVSTGFTVDGFIEGIERSDFQEPITINESSKIYLGLAEKYKDNEDLFTNLLTKMGTLIKKSDEVKKFRSQRQENQKEELDKRKAAVEEKQETSNDLIRMDVMLNQAGLRKIFTREEDDQSAKSEAENQRRLDQLDHFLKSMINRYLELARRMHDIFIEVHGQDPYVARFDEFYAQAQTVREEFDGAREMFRISDATFGEELEHAMRHETYRIGLRLTTMFLNFLSSYFNQERLTLDYHAMVANLLDVRQRVQNVGIQAFNDAEWNLLQQINLHAVVLEPDRYRVELFDWAYELERFSTFHMQGILAQLNEAFINVLVRSRNFAGIHGLLARFMPALERVETQVAAGAGGGGAGGGAETEPDDDDEGAGGQGNTTMTDSPRPLVVTATAGQGGRTVVTATRGQAQPPPGGTGRTTATRGRGAGSPSGL